MKTSTTPTNGARLPSAAAPEAGQGLPRWMPWLVALIFATVLVSLPIDAFKDRQNYLNYFTGAPLILLSRAEGGVVSMLANEPLYVLICLVLNVVMEPEEGLRVLIFAGAFLVAFNSMRLAPKHLVLVLCFLLTPQVLKNHVVHLRQGLAIGVFLTGWNSTRPRLRWTFMLLAPLIHSSFVFILLLMGVGSLLRRFTSSKIVAFAVYAILGLGIGLLLGVVAQRLGARQGDEFEFVADPTISGQGFAFWTLPLALLFMQSRQFVAEHLLEIGSMILYLATYFLSPVTGRVFESSLILILIAGLRMHRRSRLIFLVLVGTYAAMQWLQIAYGVNPIFSPEDL